MMTYIILKDEYKIFNSYDEFTTTGVYGFLCMDSFSWLEQQARHVSSLTSQDPVLIVKHESINE
jgi:hypothetical protein